MRAIEKSMKQEKYEVEGKSKKDLELMLTILDRAWEGVSMNQISFCLRSHVYRSDYCPMGLRYYSHKGGY